jgi:hypothetical protein
LANSQALLVRSSELIIRLMTEPAQNYQKIQATSTEGMDQIFDVVAEVLDVSMDVDGPGVAEVLDDGHQIPLIEAAKILNIARRSALRLIHEGKLDGAKDGHGQWFVKASSLNKRITAKSKSQSPVEQEDTRVDVGVDEDHDHQGWTGVQSNGHDALLREVLGKLEALTYRNGYLESQLSEREKEIELQRNQIKLLTDSQHKTSLWARFKNWCLGN